MWVLRTMDGTEICRRDSAEEIGKEKLWYENRGYSVKVDRERPKELDQSSLLL